MPWARAIGRFLRSIAPRESADIWPNIQSTGTAYVLRRKRNGDGAASSPQLGFGFVDKSTRNSDGSISQSLAGLTFGNVNPNGINLEPGVNPYPISFLSDGHLLAVSSKAVAAGTSYNAGINVTINPDSAGDGTNVPEITVIDWNVYAVGSWPANTATEGFWPLWTITVSAQGVISCLNPAGGGNISYGYAIGAGVNGHYFDPA